MKKVEKICKNLIFPPLWLILIYTAVSIVGLITAFKLNTIPDAVTYGIYGISAYTLTVLVLFIVKILPRMISKAKEKVYEHPLGNRYMTDAAFKVRISLYISLAINLVFSAFKLTSGIIYSSPWFVGVALYYILLSVIRFLLLRYMRQAKDKNDKIDEYRRYRLCGVLMLILNASLSGIVFQMVWKNEGYDYPGILIFVVALYTFYSVIISIVDMVRYRKYESPVISASKAIRFAAALVSMLSLETAMLVQFGDDETMRRIMTGATGTAVCLIVLTLSAFMIIHGSKAIKRLKIKQTEEGEELYDGE